MCERKKRSHSSDLSETIVGVFTSRYFCGIAVILVLCSNILMPFLLGVFRRALMTMSDSYVSGSHSMAFVTVPDMDVAKKISHGLVKNKLAACVNIIPGVLSVYEWENKVNEDQELILMIKTSTEKVPELSKFVTENHPYDVAEVISSKIDDGNPPYLKWIGEVVKGVPAGDNK